MFAPNHSTQDQQVLAFFELIQQGQSLAEILKMYQEHPELLSKQSPITKLRPIDYACSLGHTHVVELLIALGASHSSPNPQDANKAPIHYAAQNGHAQTVKFLMAQGADIEVLDDNENDISSFAHTSNNQECITVCANPNKYRSLLKSIQWHNSKEISSALSNLKNKQFQINCPRSLRPFFYADEDIATWACLDNNPEVFKSFCPQKMDRDEVFKYLTLALCFGRKKMIICLMSFPASLTLPDVLIDVCYECAVFSGDTTIIDLIKPMIFNRQPDSTIKFAAISSGSVEMLKKIGLKEDELKTVWRTALKYAVQSGQVAMVQEIIKIVAIHINRHKQKQDPEDRSFENLLRIAVGVGNLAILDAILTLDSRLCLDESYLANAIAHGHWTIVEMIFIYLKGKEIDFSRYIASAIKSADVKMLEKVLEKTAEEKLKLLDSSHCLELAILSCSTAMVNKVLTIFTDITINNKAVALAISTSSAEMERHIRRLMIAQQVSIEPGRSKPTSASASASTLPTEAATSTSTATPTTPIEAATSTSAATLPPTTAEALFIQTLSSADTPEHFHYLVQRNPMLIATPQLIDIPPVKVVFRPIDYAAWLGFFHTVQYFIVNEIDANAPNDNNLKKVPLHYAAEKGRLATIKLLLANEADPYAVDAKNATLFDYAKSSGNKECIEYCSNQKKLRAHFLINQLWKNTIEVENTYFNEALTLIDEIYEVILERASVLPDQKEQLLLCHVVHIGEDENPDTLLSKLMHQKGFSKDRVSALKQLWQGRSTKDSKQFREYPPELSNKIWCDTITRIGQHATGFARSSQFFSSVTQRYYLAKTQQEFETLGSLAKAYPWENIAFITAVFTRLRRNYFTGIIPYELLKILHSKDNFSLWCVLDDNIELFRNRTELSLEDHGMYFGLAIAFGRVKMANYLIKYVTTVTTYELKNLYKCAIFSGLASMIDLVMKLKSKEIVEHIKFRLASQCAHPEDVINSALQFKEHAELVLLDSSEYRSIGNNIVRFSESSYYIYVDFAINSGNPVMLERMLNLYPDFTFNQNHLCGAASSGSVAMFNAVLSKNKAIKVDQRVLQSALLSGNSVMVERVLSLNSDLKFEVAEYKNAIHSGNTLLFEKFPALNIRLLRLQKSYHDVNERNFYIKCAINDAIESRSLKMLGFVVSLYRAANPVMPNLNAPLQDGGEPNNPLGLAVLMGVPELIDALLVIDPTLTLDIDSLKRAISTCNPNMVEKVLQRIPALINDPEFAAMYRSNREIFDCVRDRVVDQINQRSANANVAAARMCA